MRYYELSNTRPTVNSDVLETFLSNLSADGTYEVHEDILRERYQNLASGWRDADLTMVAGAYKAGAIAMMDKDGNIVDLGFSRSSQRSYTNSNKDILLASINVPRLDYLTYKCGIDGYLIEQSGYTWQGNTGFYRVPDNSVSSVINGNNTFSQTWKMTENAVSGSTRAIVHEPLVTQFSGIGVVTISAIFRVNSNDRLVVVGVSNGPVVGSSNIRFNPNDNTFIHTGANPACFDISIRNYYEDWKILKFSINVNYTTNAYVILRFSLTNLVGSNTFIGIPTNTYEVMSFTAKYNDTSESPRYGNTVVNTFQQNDEDIVSPITLPYDSIIHIKTAKGIQEFILPAGTFDINDYVVNDKLICFAIKYIPDIEDFINNLTLDGTYTFDDDVIRDSWNDLINRISTNSTFLRQFCNSDHIVLPYAYKTGYVAAMDLSDGGIVDIEFDRSGSAYGIMDEFILSTPNTPVLDGAFYNENVVGYLFEEPIRNVVTGFDALTLSQSGDFYSLSNPRIMTIYNNTIQSRSRFNYIRNSASAYKWFFRSMLLPNKDNIGTKTTTLGTNTNGPVVIHDIKDEPPKLKGYKLIESALTSSTAGNVSGGVFVFIASVWSSSTGMVVGDNGKVLFLNMIMVDNSVTSIDQVPKKILPNATTCSRDWLKTESYSKICTVGEKTGMRIGYNTDPQSLVINDKINFIFLKN